jgi:hypothetical protein
MEMMMSGNYTQKAEVVRLNKKTIMIKPTMKKEFFNNLKELSMKDSNTDIRNIKAKDCCLCGDEMECILVGKDKEPLYGNNADPISKGHGRCCDDCNFKKVISARILLLKNSFADKFSKK